MPRLSDILDKASDAYADGELQKAIAFYKQAEKLDRNCVEALEWLGELYVQTDKIKQALGYYKRALKLNPKFAEYANLGYCYYELGEAKLAVEALGKAIAMNGKDNVSHSNYGKALYDYYVNVSAEEARERAAAWRRDFPKNRDAQFMGAAISGQEIPSVADGEFVRDIFDDFAVDFDSKLAELEYAAPQLLAQLSSGFSANSGRILDLGCGTGLLGVRLREMYSDSYLYGIDLSPKMLKEAKKRKLYDGLESAEIVTWLGDYKRERREGFDMVFAADVFCYFGDLQGALRGVRDVLTNGGLVIFSVELGNGSDDYVLHESGRYRHGYDYVSGLDVGLQLLEVRRDTLRTEYGNPVEGLLVVMKKK